MPRDSQIQLRRGTAAGWTGTNPVLANGEPGIETDTLKWKVGDGSTAWNSLAYFGGGASGVSSFATRTGAVVPVTGDYYGAVAAALSGATSASRYAGATTSGHPTAGTFATGDWVVAQDGHVWICTSGGTPGTWADAGGSGAVSSVFTRTGAVVAANADYYGVVAAALTGVTGGAARFVGSLATGGTPASGTFLKGDYLIGQDATIWVCTTAGTPGTWTQVGGGGGAVSSVFTRTGAVVATTGDYTAAQVGALGATAAAGGVLGGNYPNPTFATGMGSTLLFSSVLGADTASIDTGAAGIAGGYNILEIWIVGRSDKSAIFDTLSITVNNDTGSNYDRQLLQGVNASVSSGPAFASAAWTPDFHGASGAASYPTVLTITMPAYAATTFFKAATMTESFIDTTAADTVASLWALAYRSTTAISRMKIAASGSQKLKAGSSLYIYGR